MSYCRFSEADVYMFLNSNGYIDCCACSLAPLVPTVATKGCTDHPFFGTLPPCPHCEGEGCEHCMMHDSMQFHTFDDAINHLLAHREAGDYVPDHAIERLREEKAKYGTLEALLNADD